MDFAHKATDKKRRGKRRGKSGNNVVLKEEEGTFSLLYNNGSCSLLSQFRNGQGGFKYDWKKVFTTFFTLARYLL
jgi:hypothetical protein